MTPARQLRWLAWQACALLALVLGALCILSLALALANAFVLTFGIVSTGEHMIGDQVAPSLIGALSAACFSAMLLLAIRKFRRYLVRRAAEAGSFTEQEESRSDALA